MHAVLWVCVHSLFSVSFRLRFEFRLSAASKSNSIINEIDRKHKHMKQREITAICESERVWWEIYARSHLSFWYSKQGNCKTGNNASMIKKKTINFRRRMKSDPNNNEQQPTKAGHVIFHSQMIPLLSHVTFMLKWLGHLKNWSINLASVSLLLDSFQVEEVFSLSALLVVSSSKQHHLCKRNVAVNYADCNNLCYPSNKFRTMWEPPFWINCRAKRFPLLWLYFEPHYVIHRCDFLVSIHVLPVFFLQLSIPCADWMFVFACTIFLLNVCLLNSATIECMRTSPICVCHWLHSLF